MGTTVRMHEVEQLKQLYETRGGAPLRDLELFYSNQKHWVYLR